MKMFINYRLKAKRQMAIFATLGSAGFALCVMAGLAMAEIPHQDFAFWAMMGVGMVGFFTLFWSALGFIFGLIDYKSLS
jgi:predicted membrane-bound dolichyl-phosphate-mannose-protein mannosyltransferase